MADPTTLSGSVMYIEYSDTPGGAKKSAVCQSEGSFDGSRNVVSDETNTKKYWHLTDSTETVYHGGYGWISALGQQNTSGQTAKFTMTIEIEGDIDTEPQS